MRARSSLFLLLLFGFSNPFFSQTSVFLKKAEEVFHVQDSSFQIESAKVDKANYDFQQMGMNDLEEKLLWALRKTSQSSRDDLRKSSTLTVMADLAINTWKGAYFSSADKWFKLNRYFNRVSRLNQKPFHEIVSASCRIKLINNQGKNFFYLKDSENPTGLNLYFGTKKEKSKQGDSFDLQPLPFYTDEELLQQAFKEIRTTKMYRELKRGSLSFIGIRIEIDEKTLYHNQIPTARIVLIAAARRQIKTVKQDAQTTSNP